MAPKTERNKHPIGTILAAVRVGCEDDRRQFYRVVAYTEVGSPRVIPLVTTGQRDPVTQDATWTTDGSRVEDFINILGVRWVSKEKKWRLKCSTDGRLWYLLPDACVPSEDGIVTVVTNYCTDNYWD